MTYIRRTVVRKSEAKLEAIHKDLERIRSGYRDLANDVEMIKKGFVRCYISS